MGDQGIGILKAGGWGVSVDEKRDRPRPGARTFRNQGDGEEAVGSLSGVARKVGDRGTGPDRNPPSELHLSELLPVLECGDIGEPVILPGAPGWQCHLQGYLLQPGTS